LENIAHTGGNGFNSDSGVPSTFGSSDSVLIVTAYLQVQQASLLVQMFDIANTLAQFVTAHQAFLNILTTKAGLLTIVPAIGTPVTDALKNTKSALEVKWIPFQLPIS
jgi:hypothetical protein